MARFEFWEKGKYANPRETYTGDYLKREKEFVEVWTRATSEEEGEMIAAIRLGEGDDVRKVSD
jgi:hypothetical protein